MKVQYTGTADVRSFSKSDFAQANLDQGVIHFRRNEPVEVSSEVGAALISSDGLFGPEHFAEVTEENADPAGDPADDPDQLDLLGDDSTPETKKAKSKKN